MAHALGLGLQNDSVTLAEVARNMSASVEPPRRNENVNLLLGPRLINLLRRQVQRLEFKLFAPMLDVPPTPLTSVEKTHTNKLALC